MVHKYVNYVHKCLYIRTHNNRYVSYEPAVVAGRAEQSPPSMHKLRIIVPYRTVPQEMAVSGGPADLTDSGAVRPILRAAGPGERRRVLEQPQPPGVCCVSKTLLCRGEGDDRGGGRRADGTCKNEDDG